MVFFTCNNCGDSVKKPKVEKHISVECNRRRNGSASLSCMDCSKDFNGQTYREHTKCVTEEERYSAPGFVPKPSSNKGERKQCSWLDIVRSTLSKPSLTHAQRTLLHTISNYENIPRKRNKFQNFVFNSSQIKVPFHIIDEVYDFLETEFKSASSSNVNNKEQRASNEMMKENSKPSVVEEVFSNLKKLDDAEILKENDDFTTVQKKKKKKKDKLSQIEDGLMNDNEISKPSTTERIECKIINEDSDVPGEYSFVKTKNKKHKNKELINLTIFDTNKTEVEENPRPMDYEATSVCTVESEVYDTQDKKMKRKKRKLDETESENGQLKRSRVEIHSNNIGSTRFSWDNIVRAVLEKSKGKEISMKKMTKKVVAEYQSFYSTDKTFEEIAMKLNKKIKKLPFVIVSKERVRLIMSV